MTDQILPDPAAYQEWRSWARALIMALKPGSAGPQAPRVLLHELKRPDKPGVLIYIPNAAGGETLAFSDESGNWRDSGSGDPVS